MPEIDYGQRAHEARMGVVGARNTTALAEQGAAQLERYGASGQQWAQRLRQNPQAALAMAKQYGGFGQIEAGMRYAEANGQGATANSLARIGLETGGPQAFQEIMAGQARADMAAQAGRADDHLKVEGVFKLRKELTDASEPFFVRRSFYQSAIVAANKAAETEDENDRGAADFALVQSMGKMVDPGSVVRNEEGTLIMESGSDKMSAFLFEVQKWFGKTGIVNPKARLRLMEQIDAQYQGHLTEQSSRVGVFSNEVNSMEIIDPRHLNLAIPDLTDPAKLPELIFDFDPWDDDASWFQFEEDVKNLPMGGVIEDPDGYQMKKTANGLVDVEGN
jgi:hypothetical protein